jgi:PBP1b-binding outer membrane lipoprotein LpoB
MYKKITLLALSAMFLGGCTLTDLLQSNQAATDQQSQAVATATPAPATEFATVPPLSPSTDVDSLEADLNNTVILDEDYSDIPESRD